MKERFKSPVLWTALIALVAFIAKTWCKLDIPGIDEFTDLFLSVLIAFGVCNNPTDRNNF